MPPILPVMIRKLLRRHDLPQFHSLLNLWAIDDDAVIGLDLQMTFAYELILPDLLHREENSIDSFFASVKNFLHDMPDNITVQFIVQASNDNKEKIENYRKTILSTDPIAELVVKRKVEHLNDMGLHTKRYFMFLTTYPDKIDLARFQIHPMSIINTNFKKITAAQHDLRIRKLKEIAQMLNSTLKSEGVKLRQMDRQEIIKYLYEYINPSRSQFQSIGKIDAGQTLRSQIVFNACESDFDHHYLDGYYYRAVNLYTRPECAHFTMVSKMLNMLEPEYDVVFTINSGSQPDLTEQVQKMVTQSRMLSHTKPFVKYHEADLKTQHAEELIEYVKSKFQKLYKFSVCAILRSRSLENLTVKTNTAVRAFRNLGEAEGGIDDMNHLFLYLTALPNHSHLNLRKHIFHSEAIAQMIPVSQSWIGCRTPKLLFPTDDNQLLPLDIFDPDITSAKNGLILGVQGAGKSFTVNTLLTNYYIESEKNHIVVIDVGGSYRKICKLFGGEYLEIDITSGKYAFNPFPAKATAIKNSDKNNFKIDSDVIQFLTLLLQKMLKIKELAGREQKLLENVIIATYKFSDVDPPLLGLLEKLLLDYDGDPEDKQIAREFGKNLSIWTTGRYGDLVNKPSTLNPTSRLVVFDLQKLKEQPELQTIVFFLIQSVIGNKLKDLSLRKIVAIDEGWQFFSDPIGSELIINMYKTIRKFNGLVWAISQSPTDFLKTLAADAIITNSVMKIILKIESGYEMLSKFGLSEPEIESARNLRSSLNYKEVFLKFDKNCRVIKIAPSPVDYWICTTDSTDRVTEDNYRAEHPEYTEVQILEGLSEKRR